MSGRRPKWIEHQKKRRARALKIRIEDELERRGIQLEGSGHELAGPCPKCEGEDRFSINTEKQVWNCRQCKTDNEVGNVIGLVMWLDNCDYDAAVKTLTPAEPEPKPNGKGRELEKVVAAEYPYHDENGALAFVVERVEYKNADGSFALTESGKRKKSFRQKRPDPDHSGKWLWKVKGHVPIIPYRLPELKAAIARDEMIAIAEGEAKVDLLRSMGIAATTCPQGAESWEDEHSKYLEGGDVIILPDNDDIGRAHADQVAASLSQVAKTIKILELPNLPPKGDIVDWVAAGGTVETLRNLIAEAKSWIEGNLLNDAEPAASAASKLTIDIRAGERHLISDAIEKGLIRKRRPVYHRGGMLVEPLYRWEKTAEENRDTLVTQFLKLNELRLSYMVAKHVAKFRKWNEPKKRWNATNPPKDAIEQLLERGHWEFPTVKGIINSPTMRSDGSILIDEGYDPRTQLWYKSPGDIELPPIPARPTKKQAQASLDLLRQLLSGFPFRDDEGVSEAVAIAGLMTPVLRGAFDHTPAFLFLAPESGTGKTYLVTTISMIATGRHPMAIVGCVDKEEMEKRLQSAAFAAMPILNLNNLDFNLESSLLNQMITEDAVGIRLFGRNDQIVSCDCRGMTIFANGNNIAIVGDLVRRTLTAHLDAGMENPEERDFKFDPIELVKADRGKYLAAIFTITRAYIEAGWPQDSVATPLAGFGGWSRMVRGPLTWLGLSDPVVSLKEARQNDPNRAGVHRRSEALLDCYGTEKNFTSSDIYQKGQEMMPVMNGAPVFRYQELRDAFTGEKGGFSSNSIARFLAADLDRVSGDHKLKRVSPNESKHGHVYRMVGPRREPKGEVM